MAGETVLLYNCSGPQWSKLRQVFVMQKLRMKAVEPGQYGLPLAQVLEGSGEPAGVEEEFSDPMLVFCSLTGPQLDRLLGAMKRAKLPPIPLKAVLTPTNRDWTSQQLWQELRREHQAMQERQGKYFSAKKALTNRSFRPIMIRRFSIDRLFAAVLELVDWQA